MPIAIAVITNALRSMTTAPLLRSAESSSSDSVRRGTSPGVKARNHATSPSTAGPAARRRARQARPRDHPRRALLHGRRDRFCGGFGSSATQRARHVTSEGTALRCIGEPRHREIAPARRRQDVLIVSAVAREGHVDGGSTRAPGCAHPPPRRQRHPLVRLEVDDDRPPEASRPSTRLSAPTTSQPLLAERAPRQSASDSIRRHRVGAVMRLNGKHGGVERLVIEPLSRRLGAGQPIQLHARAARRRCRRRRGRLSPSCRAGRAPAPACSRLARRQRGPRAGGRPTCPSTTMAAAPSAERPSSSRTPLAH